MSKYRTAKKTALRRRDKKTTRKSRKSLRSKTYRRRFRGGYSPVGPDGGNAGKVPDSYPSQSSGKLPDPMAAAGVPIGKETY
jgi:hypothetical protein